ncbi:hypothetical protein BWQ96_04645 [Gracilariopsis chorda]|uniref:Uncharacterized protein n=1 Tax=Gracilariopsis chorda TaxID=448386 RepID=A0A2V3ITV6_9FLOR|nr:hypothetical protein BWQ96_04645 [Gracilariopsis chorda]|eukprot:PXF45568.1 hypothetical protein BWQ96_04645 [Gracilariopsis chorda]
MFPGIFVALTDEDYKEHFNGKRFRGQWKDERQIPTVGSIIVSQRDDQEPVARAKKGKDPKKVLSDCRLLVTKLMTKLTLAEHVAIRGKDLKGAEHARRRVNALYNARYLVPSFADAYRNGDSEARHSKKSQILSAVKLSSLQGVDGASLNEFDEREGVLFYYGHEMPVYSSVMVDLMNDVWSRGTDGRRGNSLFHVTVLKRKQIRRLWSTGRRRKYLRQRHVHIDDPRRVILGKHGEQARRDFLRRIEVVVKKTGGQKLHRIGFRQPIVVPWAILIRSISIRDAICSLHLLCSGLATMELAEENSIQVDLFLYGGCFCIPSNCLGINLGDLVIQLKMKASSCEQPRQGEVLITERSAPGDSSLQVLAELTALDVLMG